MTPEDILRRIGEHRRHLALIHRRREVMAANLLRWDIQYLLCAGHNEDFDQGWPHHHNMAKVPYWPPFTVRLHAWRN